MLAKILKQTDGPLPESQKMEVETLSENRLEDLKKIEKFIDNSKREVFWRALN